jgi:hypothetical protein
MNGELYASGRYRRLRGKFKVKLSLCLTTSNYAPRYEHVFGGTVILDLGTRWR